MTASVATSSRKRTYKTAVLIIGNEILSGQTLEKNLAHIAAQLNTRGMRVTESRVIEDDIDTIARHAQTLAQAYDYVFTTGGIGPTHDDMTAEAIAKAFDEPFILHPEAHRVLQEHYGDQELNPARLRMAYMPQRATLIPNEVSKAPGFRIKNVFVMAGIPRIMHSMMEHVLQQLPHGDAMNKVMYTCSAIEGDIAEDLQELQKRFPAIEVGSYPTWADSGAPVGVKVTGRTQDQTALTEFQHALEDVFTERDLEFERTEP